jgi:hypothetical protein
MLLEQPIVLRGTRKYVGLEEKVISGWRSLSEIDSQILLSTFMGGFEVSPKPNDGK